MDGRLWKDFDYFHANYDEIYSKHKNEFFAVKNLKVYHDANPAPNLLEQLRVDDEVITVHIMEFLKGW